MQPHDTTPHKICTKCGESKPATSEYFAPRQNSHDGFRHTCKQCKHEYDRARREANPGDNAKRCHAYREANKEHLEQRRRDRYRANPEPVRARAKAWYEANRDRASEYHRAYYEANKESINERNRAAYAANRDKRRAYRQANRERRNEQARAWREANKQHVAEYSQSYKEANKERQAIWWQNWYAANRLRVIARASTATKIRRARKRNAQGTHTAADIQAQYERQKGRCYYCDTKVGNTYHIDHVIPLSRGGSDSHENLVIACPPCNLSKGDKLPHEWVQGGRLL